mgnify:CR=1 FL=1
MRQAAVQLDPHQEQLVNPAAHGQVTNAMPPPNAHRDPILPVICGQLLRGLIAQFDHNSRVLLEFLPEMVHHHRTTHESDGH